MPIGNEILPLVLEIVVETQQKKNNEPQIAPPPGLEQLDALLQHRSRLGALVLLSGAEALNFTRLKTLLDETDGNLGAQLRKLEEAGYVKVKKTFEDRKPVSWYSISPAGQKALKAHLKALEALIKSAGV